MKRPFGFMLLPVVLLITLLAVVGIMINHEGALGTQRVASSLEAQRADHVAQAGFNHALWQLADDECGPFANVPTTPLGTDSYSATVTTVPVTQTKYSLSPDRDSWLSESAPDNNFGGDTELKVKNAPSDSMRAVYFFDLSAFAPGTRVASAKLKLHVNVYDDVDKVDIHRLTKAWLETDATWNTLAAEFDPEVFASIAPHNVTGFIELNFTAQAQTLVNDPAGNHGIILIANSNSRESTYTSRENQKAPLLKLVTGDAVVSTAAVSSTGTLANGVTRDLTRSDVTVRQPLDTVFAQPGTALADTYAFAFKPSDNYGSQNSLQIGDAGQVRYDLIRFDSLPLPHGARVRTAELSLNVRSVFTTTATSEISAFRMLEPWTEDGATFNTSDGSTPWSWPANYDVASPVATVAFDSPVVGNWYTWDISALVQGWVDGTYPNYGLVLVGFNGINNSQFHSGDATDPTLTPMLTITYSCECGAACLAPQGSGSVLMLVGDDSVLTPRDLTVKTMMESWGYTVDLVNDNTSASGLQSAMDTRDVLYVADSVNVTTVGTKLTTLPAGVVSGKSELAAGLGFAAGQAWPVGDSVDVVDTSHYITLPFAGGPLDIYDAAMETATLSGTLSPDVDTLATVSSASALATLDVGGALAGGGSAPARRVVLPFGRGQTFNWDYVNSNGRLLLQRALQWSTGAGIGGAGNLLMVVANPGGLTTQETARRTLIESFGYSVTLIDDDDAQASFDTAVAASDVAYVPPSVSAASFGTKLVNAAIGVVNEQPELVNEFGFGAQGSVWKSRDEIDVIDNTHYITSPFATGLLTITSSVQDLYLMTAGLGGGFEPLANAFNTGTLWDVTLGAIDTGGVLYGGGNAAGRRVQLPWSASAFDINALNADGVTILQRALQWGTGASAGSGGPSLNVLFVVGDAATLSSKDAGRKTLMESWGFAVTVIDDGDSQANFDAAAAAADVVYVSGTIGGGALADKLTGSGTGIVNEFYGKLDNFGFSSSTGLVIASVDAFTKTDAGHYVSEPFSGNPVSVFTTPLNMSVPGGILAPDLQNVGEVSGTQALVTLEAGATRFDGNPAPARRLHLPFASAETSELTGDGKTILKRALEWVGSTAASCDADYTPDTKLSEFSTSAYGSNNIQGLTYLPAGKSFNAVAAPAGGAWISVNYADGRFYMTDTAGAH
ncbi:MAG: DNRLRE domain-containing protein, partial [Gammaproteobacteria bacterium]|nr:DNRLRE domain-containing protein [Gammaproteobacteria bacterium]